MPLARFDAPFEHPDWTFEPKLDGFRAVAYVEGGACRLVSRNRNTFKTFEPLAQAIGQELAGRSAILDGEIVHPGPAGRPLFYELMRRRGPCVDVRWPAVICRSMRSAILPVWPSHLRLLNRAAWPIPEPRLHRGWSGILPLRLSSPPG